jgi:hypothetical protein
MHAIAKGKAALAAQGRERKGRTITTACGKFAKKGTSKYDMRERMIRTSVARCRSDTNKGSNPQHELTSHSAEKISRQRVRRAMNGKR